MTYKDKAIIEKIMWLSTIGFQYKHTHRQVQATVPKELVEVAVFHVLKHHNKGIALHTHAVERDDVFMLQIGQQLSLTMEVLPGILTGLFQSLKTQNVYKYTEYTDNLKFSMPTSTLNSTANLDSH